MLAPIERVGYLTGILLLASGLVHLAILLTSGGSWNGPLSWRKPTTFGLSFGLTLMTIVWVTSFVRLRERTRALQRLSPPQTSPWLRGKCRSTGFASSQSWTMNNRREQNAHQVCDQLRAAWRGSAPADRR
jgi:hypothetical protein